MTARKRAALYLRLSETSDASTSIARQEADLKDLAEREGWKVVHVLTHDGVSGRKEREKATEALRLLASGEVDVLAVWKLDVALLSYPREFAAGWRMGADLGLSDHNWQCFTREVLVALYPVAITIPHLPEEDA